MKRVLLVYCLVTCGMEGLAQYPGPELASLEVAPSARALALVEDHRKALWVLTNQGLLAYTGTEAVQRLSWTGEGVSISSVGKELWIGMANGHVLRYDVASNVLLDTLLNVGSAPITGISAKGEQIAISTGGDGIYILQSGDTLHLNSENALRDGFVYDVLTREDRRYVAHDRGISILGDYASQGEVALKVTTALALLQGQLVAASYEAGLSIFEPDLHRRRDCDYFFRREIHKLDTFEQKLLVLDKQGLFALDPDDLQVDTLQLGSWNTFYRHSSGILLLLGEAGQVHTLDLRFKEVLTEALVGGTITAVAQHRDTLALAANGSVHLIAPGNSLPFRAFKLHEGAVVSDLEWRGSELYVATFDKGMYQIHTETGRRHHISDPGRMGSTNCLSLTSSDHSLWLATLAGVARSTNGLDFEPVAHTAFNRTYCYDLEASGEHLLLGTDGSGLYITELTSTALLTVHMLGDTTVYAVATDQFPACYIATAQGGVLYGAVGSGSNELRPLLPAQKEVKGLIAVNESLALGFSTNMAYLLNGSANWTVPLFDLPRKISSGEYLHASTSTAGGSTYFMCDGQLLQYRPTPSLEALPQFYLSDIEINGKPGNFSDRKLPTGTEVVVCKVNPVWYQGPAQVQFRYRLQSSEEWSLLSSSEIRLASLGYGSSLLEIEAGIGGVFFAASRQRIPLIIDKPIYLKTWFVAGSLLTLLSLAFAGGALRNRSMLKRKKLNEERLRSELNVLRAQVNPHFLFNSFNTLLSMVENEEKEAAEYLQRLADYYRKILQSEPEDLVILRQEVANLEEYLYLQKKRLGAALEWSIDLSEAMMHVKVPAMTLQILAENAIKHNQASRKSPLQLYLFARMNTIYMENNFQPKAQKPIGTSTGLTNVAERYELLLGRRVSYGLSGDRYSVALPAT